MDYLLIGFVCLVIGVVGGIYLTGWAGCNNKTIRDYLMKRFTECEAKSCEECK